MTESTDAEPTAAGPTGHSAIDQALTSLDALAETPVTEHAAVFDEIHQVLRTALADAGRAEP
ncbi:MAG: hypothetical protein QM597_02975 [Aeromicrobium sp.]|uniref:hypothetical protein n=1 Tax=Aeromicrobium sp. TaxID=1871063 RepID=UPI0039E465EF